MRNFMGLVLGICFLYYLAYLPSFIFFVFIGQHIQPLLGLSERVFIIISNLLFASLFLLFILWDNKKIKIRDGS
jgi:hypothetical protein